MRRHHWVCSRPLETLLRAVISAIDEEKILENCGDRRFLSCVMVRGKGLLTIPKIKDFLSKNNTFNEETPMTARRNLRYALTGQTEIMMRAIVKTLDAEWQSSDDFSKDEFVTRVMQNSSGQLNPARVQKTVDDLFEERYGYMQKHVEKMAGQKAVEIDSHKCHDE